MFKYLYGISAVLVAGLVIVQIARPQAEDNALVNSNTASTSAAASYQLAPPQTAIPFLPSASRLETAGLLPTDDSSTSVQRQWLPVVASQSNVGVNGASQYGSAASQIAPVPLPAVTPVPSTHANAGIGQSDVQAADGTWRDDGRYITINFNGKEMKLLKASSNPSQNGQKSIAACDNQIVPVTQSPQPAVPADNGIYLLPPTEPETIGSGPIVGESSPAGVHAAEGTVHGRLLQRGYPLVNCYVVIAPWPKGDKSDSSVDTRIPLSTMTNDAGFYCFEHVPAGDYKLTWLPDGTKQWIRRIAMRPDVIVHEGQDVTLKDIRMAQQTIN